MRVPVAIAASLAVFGAAPAFAQPPPAPPPEEHAEPWRGPTDQPGMKAAENRARVTSDVAAAGPSASEQKEARALAAAVFAKPAAGQRAADKVGPDATPEWAVPPPRSEATEKAEIAPGGRGVKLTKPF